MKVPTAEEFLDFDPRISTQWSDEIKANVISRDDVELAMIEFAKLHVKAALKAASKISIKSEYVGQWEQNSSAVSYTQDKEGILNSYPETNIL